MSTLVNVQAQIKGQKKVLAVFNEDKFLYLIKKSKITNPDAEIYYVNIFDAQE